MLVMLQFEESEDTKAWLTKNNFPRQMRAIWNCRHYRTSIFRHNVFFPRTPPEANMAWSREAPWPLILRNSFSVASDIFCTPVELSRPPRPLKIYARPLKISFTTETLSIYLGMDGAIVFIGLRIATPMSFVRAITRESRDAIKQCDSKPRRRESRMEVDTEVGLSQTAQEVVGSIPTKGATLFSVLSDIIAICQAK